MKRTLIFQTFAVIVGILITAAAFAQTPYPIWTVFGTETDRVSGLDFGSSSGISSWAQHTNANGTIWLRLAVSGGGGGSMSFSTFSITGLHGLTASASDSGNTNWTIDAASLSNHFEAEITAAETLSLGGDLTGSLPNPTVAKIRGTTVKLAGLADGDAIVYDAASGTLTNKAGAVFTDLTTAENTWTKTNHFNLPIIVKGTAVFSNDVQIGGNLNVTTNITAGGNISATGTITAGHFPASQIDSGTITPGILPDKTPTNMIASSGSFTWDGANRTWNFNPPSSGAVNQWQSNGLSWATSDTFGFSNASSIVAMLFSNINGVPTIYLQPDSTIARTGQSQTWSAQQTFNSSATVTFGAKTWFKNSVTVSDCVAVVSNQTIGGSLTVGGNATFTANVNAGSFTGSLDGGNITGNGSVTTNVLSAFGSNTGTIGSAGQFLVVHLNSAGIPDSWSTVTGNSLATSTNSISAVQLGGSWNNGVVGASFSNFSVATINGTTVTVGFASAPFENIIVLNGTTNYTIHGSSLTLSNLLTAYGVTLTNRGNAQIDFGGTVTMLSNGAGAFVQLAGTSTSSTQNWSGSGLTVVTIPTSGQPLRFQPNGNVNGYQANVDVVPVDGSNSGYIYITRNSPKICWMGFSVNDNGSGVWSSGLEVSGFAVGDKTCINFSGNAQNGGLIVANQDANTTGLGGYQFYENDPRFPRILFTNGKQTINTNTPDLHETYTSFGNWTNQVGRLDGGALIVIGSNENWLVACGRALGSVSGTSSKEYPTNRASGFLAGGLSSAASNQTFMVVRDQTNGLWCIGVDTNGVLGAYRTNDLTTTVLTY